VKKDKYDEPCNKFVNEEEGQDLYNYYNAHVYFGGKDGVQLICSSDYVNSGAGTGTGLTIPTNILSSEFKLNYLKGEQVRKNNFFICTFPSSAITPELFSQNSNAERYITIVLDYGYYKETVKNIEIQSVNPVRT
jgi:hypothetical protein